MRAIPKQAVAFVAQWEGFRAEAYLCPAGVWTIGYGHTEGVKSGDKITKAKALLYLAKDMEIARAKLYRTYDQKTGKWHDVLPAEIINELTENQWSALLSFAFNLGVNYRWGIWKRINARQFDQVPQELAKFVNAGGKKVTGLVRRRAAEQVLWSTDEPGSTDEPIPSSITRQPNTTPPTPSDPSSLAQSKTFWTGGTVAAAGVVSGAQQIQALAAPQAANNEWVAKIASIAAFLIVAGGIAIMVFRWLDKKKARA